MPAVGGGRRGCHGDSPDTGRRPRATATICHRRQHWAQMARQPRAAQGRGHWATVTTTNRVSQATATNHNRPASLGCRSPARAGTAPGTYVSSACTSLPAHPGRAGSSALTCDTPTAKSGARDRRNAHHLPTLPHLLPPGLTTRFPLGLCVFRAPAAASWLVSGPHLHLRGSPDGSR